MTPAGAPPRVVGPGAAATDGRRRTGGRRHRARPGESIGRTAMPKRGGPRGRATRRGFLGALSALATVAIVPRHVVAGSVQPPPSERLNLGCVGVGGMQGGNDVRSVSGENVYALCDVDETF